MVSVLRRICNIWFSIPMIYQIWSESNHICWCFHNLSIRVTTNMLSLIKESSPRWNTVHNNGMVLSLLAGNVLTPVNHDKNDRKADCAVQSASLFLRDRSQSDCTVSSAYCTAPCAKPNSSPWSDGQERKKRNICVKYQKEERSEE